MMSRRSWSRRAAAALCVIGSLTLPGCATSFYDQVTMRNGQHLVVGAREWGLGSTAKIWVNEGDRFVEVKVVEEER